MTTAILQQSAVPPRKDPHLIAGRYRTHTRIGQGRLGEIFAAVDESFEALGVERQVAVQVIPQSIVGNNVVFNKLNVGYSMLKAGTHPNIVDFLQFGRDGQFGFLAMELLEGASLRTLLNTAETLPLDEVKPVVRCAGEALSLLHAKDLVHGNLTTRNIFITDDLDVQLLDVVPLDSASAIFRGAAMSGPFSRCSVEDDVFALACLTYEMLSGKHPYNYSSPAEARLAGLEIGRIESLNDYEWDALRLALSFDQEQRASSISDFMRDLDISGTERLRPTIDQPASHEPGTYVSSDNAVPMNEMAVPAQNTANAEPVTANGPFSLDESLSLNSEPQRNGPRALRTVLLGILLAVLGAWSFFGQSEEQVVSLIGYVDEKMDLGLTEVSDAIVDLPMSVSAAIATTDTVEPEVVVADRGVAAVELLAVEPVAVVDTVVEESQVEIAATAIVTTTTSAEEESVSIVEPTMQQPAPADQPTVQITADTPIESTVGKLDETAEQAATDTAIDATSMPVELPVFRRVVTVYERDAVARIVPPNSPNSATPMIWWTSDGTANANQDYIGEKERVMTAASVEDGNVLRIPLVNDSLPESRETFFVNVGQRNIAQGSVDRIATIRVEIVDDDFR